MTGEAPVPADDPVMVAWEAYKASPEYENTKLWARQLAHTDGSLWAAFYAGFQTSREQARAEAIEQAAGVAREYRQRATIAAANNGPSQENWRAAEDYASQIEKAIRSLSATQEG